MSRSPFTNVSSPAGLLNSPTFRSRRNHLLLEARRRRHVGRRDHSACPCGTPASGASREGASNSWHLHWARCSRCAGPRVSPPLRGAPPAYPGPPASRVGSKEYVQTILDGVHWTLVLL